MQRPPNERFFNKIIQNFIFQKTYKQNSVRWCKFIPYSCSLKLLEIYQIMFKNTVFQTLPAKRIKLSVEMFWSSTISSIIFLEFPMFYQIFLSPLVKRCAVITYKHGIYELPHELLNGFRLRILENQERSGNCLNFIE